MAEHDTSTGDIERTCAKKGCSEPAHPHSDFCCEACEKDVRERGVATGTDQ